MESNQLLKRKKLYLKILGDNLQRRRKMLGKNQADLEENATDNYKHYSTVEKGQTEPKIWYLQEIAKGLETSLASIIAEVEKEYYTIIENEKDEE